jgi:hypothetical protein
MAVKRSPGSIIRLQTADGLYSYGRVRTSPYITFYDHRTDAPDDDLDAIVSKPALFTVAVSHSAFKRNGGWKVIGHRPLEPQLQQPILNVRQPLGDPPRFEIVDDAGRSRPATFDECKELEPLAVWEQQHVEDRIVDHYAGRPNPWLEDLRVKP